MKALIEKIIRQIVLRKDNKCCNCNSELSKGETITVITWKEKGVLHKQYYCTECTERRDVFQYGQF